MNDIIKSLKKRYSKVHPLIFARSVERSKSAGDLFDILEGIPRQMPIVWDEKLHQWVETQDILQSGCHKESND